MIFTLRSGGTAHPETSVLQNITDLISSSGVLTIAGNQFKAEAQAVPDMTVKVKIGRAYIKGSLTNSYPVRSDADENVTIAPNSSGNPRIDTVVLYVDLSAAPNSDASNVAKLTKVQGTPAASPSAPTTAEIQTAIGSANPFITLANVSVASGATSITNPNTTDIRTQAIFTIGGGGSTSFINNETPVGVVDGVNLVFTAAFPYVGFSLMVFRDGQLMVPGAVADYQETNPAMGVFTFIIAPTAGSVIRVSYQKVVSTTGNADTVDGFHANSTPTANQIPVLTLGIIMPTDTVDTASIKNNAITTAKILDANVTQAKLAPGVGGNTDHSFRIRRSTLQAIPNVTFTIITWDIDQFDTDDLHSLTINTDRITFTAPTAGKWLLSLNAIWGGGASGQKIARIIKNGGAIAEEAGVPSGANAHVQNLSVIIDIAAGDIAHVDVFQDSGAPQNFGNASIGEVWFAGIRIAT